MSNAKPFVKWAGGKTQLLHEITTKLPPQFGVTCNTYIEPFVGSGAMLFWVMQHYPNVKEIVINDINTDLINTYRVIATNANELIDQLYQLQKQYHALESKPTEKKHFYYHQRHLYNQRISSNIKQASLFIFLNRTCYNGLYRVNRKNQFNVPIGNYKKPGICDEQNIYHVSQLLQNACILSGDFQETIHHANTNALFYFDPPYKPITSTSSFTAYAQNSFTDTEQLRLRNFCDILHNQGHQWLVSNSDATSDTHSNGYFAEIYSAYNITKIKAKRSINSNAKKRGLLNEVLISNF